MFLTGLLSTFLTGVTFLLVVVVTSVWGLRAVECDTTGYSMDLRSCLRISQVDVRVFDRNSIANTSIHLEGFLDHPRNVCQEQSRYIHAFDCIRGVTFKCVLTNDSKFVADENQISTGIPYLCQHIDDMDIPCYLSAYRRVFDCVHALTGQVLQEQYSFSTQVCMAVDITHDCIQVKVDCDVKTRGILTQFHDVYRKPPACPDPTRPHRQAYITNSGAAAITSFLARICLAILALALGPALI